MGDMADFLLGQIMDADEHYEQYRYADGPTKFEQGLCDERGFEYPSPMALRLPSQKPSGPGPCPRCGAPTIRRVNGKTQKHFWGCSKFPLCRGNRNGVPNAVASVHHSHERGLQSQNAEAAARRHQQSHIPEQQGRTGARSEHCAGRRRQELGRGGSHS